MVATIAARVVSNLCPFAGNPEDFDPKPKTSQEVGSVITIVFKGRF